MWNVRLDESQTGIQIAGRNINNLKYAYDTALMVENEEEPWWASWWGWKRRVKKLAWNSTFKKWKSWHLVLSLHSKEEGKKWKPWQTSFSWASKSLWMVTAAMKLKAAHSLEERYNKPRQCIKNQRHHFADKVSYDQSCVFFRSHVCMWELHHKEGWVLKNWCFQIVVLEKTPESLGLQGYQISQS